MWLKLITFKWPSQSLQWLWDLFSSGRAQCQLRLGWVWPSVVDFSFHGEVEETLKILHFYQGEEEGLRQSVKSCQVRWDGFGVGIHTREWSFPFEHMELGEHWPC